MCAVFGYLDYKGKVSNAILKKLIRNLSIAAEIRGTDATGISYVNHGKVMTFKKAKPAHKIKLYFPRNTRAVIGHTRMTTQGSEKYNHNNHPFNGICGTETFALAHNGVLYNDAELKTKYHLPKTSIETDSYVAVQLLEQEKQLHAESIKKMAELIEGSFVFTILRNDNTLFLVKGNNPLTLYHFPALGLYIYASTKSILDNALQQVNLNDKCCEIDVSEGEILEIASNGKLSKTTFAMHPDFEKHLNQYNVIHLNMQNFLSKTQTIEQMIALVTKAVGRDLLRAYPDVDYLDKTILTFMLDDIYQDCQVPFIFIIDEWDCIFRSRKNQLEEQTKYLDFLRDLLKDKSYIALAYMTGILPIKKYGEHSAINVFYKYSMTDASPIEEFTGFTEQKVRQLCESLCS